MNIGFISTWFERGAAYVTKAYIDSLSDSNNIYVYARGGEELGKGDPNWDRSNVTWGLRLSGTNINFRHFKKWIKKNKIEVLFFNEQHESEIIYTVKKHFPDIKIGSYIDYYKENTVKEFLLYDFLVCNTKRHYSVFKDHPQCYYVPWGTDIDLYKPKEKNNENLTFFHSAGMSNRKGTSYVLDAFIKGGIYKNAKLLLHTQKSLGNVFGYNTEQLSKYNIEIIEKTVTAPGLYYLGDVFVYPTTLDGLGLTMYEALASGLAVITTNNAPMNEVINNKVGYLVDVECLRSRYDGYYWPLSIVKEESLIESMNFFIDNPERLLEMKRLAREEAKNKWNWEDRKQEINDIFTETEVIVHSPDKHLMTTLPKLEELKNKLCSTYFYHIIKSLKG